MLGGRFAHDNGGNVIMIKDSLSSFIKDSNLDKLELLLNSPNIFNVLKIEHNEIRHSNFLAWLLDPKNGHNLGDKFLRWLRLLQKS